MGSGSSKSKVRAIKICSQQLPEAPVVPVGGRTTVVTCEKKKVDNNEDISTERASSAFIDKGRSIPVDPDLKLIEDILAESEDCFFWPVSTPAKQTATASQHAKTSHGSLQQNQSTDIMNLQTKTNKPASKYEELQNKHHTAPAQKVLDIENNNLPKISSNILPPAESSTPITYDNVEEELMDSIEKEYSHIHPSSSVWET